MFTKRLHLVMLVLPVTIYLAMVIWLLPGVAILIIAAALPIVLIRLAAQDVVIQHTDQCVERYLQRTAYRDPRTSR